MVLFFVILFGLLFSFFLLYLQKFVFFVIPGFGYTMIFSKMFVIPLFVITGNKLVTPSFTKGQNEFCIKKYRRVLLLLAGIHFSLATRTSLY